MLTKWLNGTDVTLRAMVIAVYADLPGGPSSDYNFYFLKSFIENLAIAYPQHKIYLVIPSDLMDGL